MNKTLWLLLFSDIFILTGFGLIQPILAIFINDKIVGGSILTAGIAGAIFFIVKALVQLPFAKYVDSHRNKRKWLLIGTALIIAVPILYILARNIIVIYIAQAIYGISSGIAAPPWLSLWSTNLDKHHEGFEWSLYSSTLGIGTGVAAFIGALMAEYMGFVYTFIFVGFMTLLGFIVLIYIQEESYKESLNIHKHYHHKRKLVNHSHTR